VVEAVRQMLDELSLLPSRKDVIEWLSRYVLVTHANDLTAEGSVQRLLANLACEPVHIRGGALVDPLEIQRELSQRSSAIMARMAVDLSDASANQLQSVSTFLEGCLDL